MPKKIETTNVTATETANQTATATATSDFAATKGITILSKLTIAKLGIKVKQLINPVIDGDKIVSKGLNDGEKIAVASILGKANQLKPYVSAETGTTGFGLVGFFEATNYSTGEVFQSSVAYVPGALHNMVVTAVKEMKEGDASVDFAVEIYAVKDTSSSVGYRWETKQLLPPQVSDPLADMRKRLSAPLLD